MGHMSGAYTRIVFAAFVLFVCVTLHAWSVLRRDAVSAHAHGRVVAAHAGPPEHILHLHTHLYQLVQGSPSYQHAGWLTL